MLSLIITSLVSLGAFAQKADEAICQDHLLAVNFGLHRAAEMETKLHTLANAVGTPNGIRVATARLSRRLEDYISFHLDSDRSWSQLNRLEEEVNSLHLFVRDGEAAGAFSLLPLYLEWPQLLEAEVTYLTPRAPPVRFSHRLLAEMNENRRLVMQVLRAITQSSMQRLTDYSQVWEVRLKSREFGGYRVYGVITAGALYLTDMVTDHSRRKEVNRLCERLSR